MDTTDSPTAPTPRRRRHAIVGAACTVGLLAAFGLGTLAGQDEHPATRTTPAYEAPARIESTPAPDSTIPAHQLTHDERYFIDSIRVWTSQSMDTVYWTDRQLLDYGTAVCGAVTDDQTPAGYRAQLDPLIPSTATQTPADDLSYTESTAVATWCVTKADQHSTLLH